MDREIVKALSDVNNTLNVISNQLDKIIQNLDSNQ